MSSFNSWVFLILQIPSSSCRPLRHRYVQTSATKHPVPHRHIP
jgi:hypothetical protein